MRNTILLAAAMLTLISCGGTHVRRQLDDVATYIEAAPDSALAVLESIDRTSLRGNGVRAEFSLLYAMAADKNYIDTSDVNVAMPAVKYYDVHGSDEKAMKAWFYLGREQENAGSYEEAVVSYARAKELSQDSDNLHFRALIASGISDLYGRTYNHEERLLNLDEVYHFYDMACDTLNRWISIGELAVTYSNLKQWDKADSLFNDFFLMNAWTHLLYHNV